VKFSAEKAAEREEAIYLQTLKENPGKALEITIDNLVKNKYFQGKDKL